METWQAAFGAKKGGKRRCTGREGHLRLSPGPCHAGRALALAERCREDKLRGPKTAVKHTGTDFPGGNPLVRTRSGI